jgi:predicted dehydrogenase
MASYRVGIIGPGIKGVEYGVAYRFHPQTEVVAAADTDAETLGLFCDRFEVPGYADYREMLARERLDIVAAILPVGPNPDVVVECARAGVKAVQCEKPMAATLADADRMVEVCRSHGVALAVGDLDRNLPEYGIARALIDAGEIGEVSSITATGGSGTELSGGGCQVLSLVRLFAGDADAAWVTGWMAHDAASDHDQGGAGYLRFVTGAEAVLHRSPDARGMGIEAAGSRGVIRVSADVVRLWRRPDEDPGVPAAERDSWQRLQPVDGVFPEGSIRNADKGSRDGWVVPANRQAATVQALVTALDSGEAPPSDGINGRAVLEMAIAIRESHRQGHAPVRLPLADRNLRLIPKRRRLQDKKPFLGREWYLRELRKRLGTEDA